MSHWELLMKFCLGMTTLGPEDSAIWADFHRPAPRRMRIASRAMGTQGWHRPAPIPCEGPIPPSGPLFRVMTSPPEW